MASFKTESEAKQHFGSDVDVEQCERCKRWTASRADHDEGDIIGPCVDGDGDNEYDRICAECEGETDKAHYWIWINERKLWLDSESFHEGTLQGFEGDSEQCGDCGRDIMESAKLVREGGQTLVVCECRTWYVVKDERKR